MHSSVCEDSDDRKMYSKKKIDSLTKATHVLNQNESESKREKQLNLMRCVLNRGLMIFHMNI